MEKNTYIAARDALVNCANICNPDVDWQRLAATIDEDYKGEENYERQLRHLVAGLYDGLAYGNWPRERE